uniref:Uncharacterized protein n=1 Tax=Rhizophagus irregularis (strain DAOM 181602 / DAOM 197198 / MUCL 43194) TaxID=747089 RepID=U9TG62_RHIID
MVKIVLNQGDSESSEFRSVQELARCKSSRENRVIKHFGFVSPTHKATLLIYGK